MKNWTVQAMQALQSAQEKAYEIGHAELTLTSPRKRLISDETP